MGLLDSSEEEVLAKLATRVLVSAPKDGLAALLGSDISALLERSLQVVHSRAVDVEVAVGTAFQTDAKLKLHVSLSADALSISTGAGTSEVLAEVPGLFRKIAACYAAGHVIAKSLESDQFQNLPDPFVVRFSAFGVSADDLKRTILLDDAVLVGAGGVGNGFMWAASELDIQGRLTIADPKNVAVGGLNRCLYFTSDDVKNGGAKATVLAERTKHPGLEVDAFVGKFSDLVAARGRVRRVITTPDSREVRRSVQDDLPLEVLDASTTDLSEVVVHSHRQPTDGACLACIYVHLPVEEQRKIHTAEGLGLTVEEVSRGFIDEEIARKLVGLHSNLVEQDLHDLIGKAFDTVYKDQCGAGALKNAAGQQAVAPLAFISNLAGALLALELVRFEVNQSASSSYMALSPWHQPSVHARRSAVRKDSCHFCGPDKNGRMVLMDVWSDKLNAAAKLGG
jgi:molybdopterin/thiamine biosynthesis adenylyltransferase